MRSVVIVASFALAGCATIVEGARQPILVEVVPETGICALTRDGEPLGTSQPGARSVLISKSAKDITFDCSAPGYAHKIESLSSTLSPYTVASFFTLDFGLVDAATGAWMRYPARVTIVLDKR